MQKEFYADGLCFSCRQCSHCCRHEPGYVYLSKEDLTNLAAAFNMNPDVFIGTYCRWVSYYDGSEVLCLLEQKNYDCIFWNNGCMAYKARPVQCRTYPFWDFIIRDSRSWTEEASSCPGINSGTLHSYEEITRACREYRANLPVRRSDMDKCVAEDKKGR